MSSKISELTAASAAAYTDIFPIVQGGANKQLTLEQLVNVGLWRRVAQSGVAASHTGDTNETTLATVSIPPPGPNGVVRIEALWSFTNSGNAKTLRYKLGGTTIYSTAPTTTASGRHSVTLFNRNSAASQVGPVNAIGTSSAFGNLGASLATATVDMSAAVNLTLTAQLASAGETITLEAYLVEMGYKA